MLLIFGFIVVGLLLGIVMLIVMVMYVLVDVQGILFDVLNFMKVFSKGLFIFLVILVGYNVVQVFGGMGVNGVIIVVFFLFGYNFAVIIGYYVGFYDFFGLFIDLCGNIIGVLIVVWVCVCIEGMVCCFMLDDFDMLLILLIILLIIVMFVYLIIMLLGGWLFEGMLWLFMYLNSNLFGCVVLVGLFLIVVVFGVYQGFIFVYFVLMDSQGFNSLFFIFLMVGVGQVGAVLVFYWWV